MRCGSTWLHSVLKHHSDVQVSEIKEVDFFFMKRMMRHDLSWYEDLFKSRDGDRLKPVRGEISPGYARLKSWQVGQIAKLLPNLRVLLTLRHPIERLWSQTVYSFGHLDGRDIRSVGSFELVRQLERARSKLSSDYTRMVKIWGGAFGRERLHISFFDELRSNPQGFIDSVLKHIGASIPWPLPKELTGKKVWSNNSLVGYERAIPEVVHWYMADQLLEPTEQLNNLLDGQVSEWVEDLRSLSGRTQPSWRILREVNQKLLSVPERLAYEGYHAALDAKMWLRWRGLRGSYAASPAKARPGKG
jgi:Sulfotransferase family